MSGPAAGRRPWRAWDTFRASLATALAALLVFVLVSIALRLVHGGLTDAESGLLLRLLYWGTYPLVFVALGSLLWHLIRYHRGDYATR